MASVFMALPSAALALLHASLPHQRAARGAVRLPAVRCGDDFYGELQSQLAAVSALEPSLETEKEDVSVQQGLWYESGRDPFVKVSGMVSGEPSFTRLFTHRTWQSYTGKRTFFRWLATFVQWRHSTLPRLPF